MGLFRDMIKAFVVKQPTVINAEVLRELDDLSMRMRKIDLFRAFKRK